MHLKINNHIILVVLYINYQHGAELQYLYDNGLPSILLTSSDIQQHLSLLLNKYFDISPDWFTVKIVECFGKEDNIYMLYTTMVPSHELKIGKWYKIGESNDEFLEKMVYEAQRTIYR